jgi:hypothetical protein
MQIYAERIQCVFCGSILSRLVFTLLFPLGSALRNLTYNMYSILYHVLQLETSSSNHLAHHLKVKPISTLESWFDKQPLSFLYNATRRVAPKGYSLGIQDPRLFHVYLAVPSNVTVLNFL